MTTVNVRYMVDDVEAAIAFYTTHLGFHADFQNTPSVRLCCPRRSPVVAQRADQLKGSVHARRPPAESWRLEPYSPRRQRHFVRGRSTSQLRGPVPEQHRDWTRRLADRA